MSPSVITTGPLPDTYVSTDESKSFVSDSDDVYESASESWRDQTAGLSDRKGADGSNFEQQVLTLDTLRKRRLEYFGASKAPGSTAQRSMPKGILKAGTHEPRPKRGVTFSEVLTQEPFPEGSTVAPPVEESQSGVNEMKSRARGWKLPGLQASVTSVWTAATTGATKFGKWYRGTSPVTGTTVPESNASRSCRSYAATFTHARGYLAEIAKSGCTYAASAWDVLKGAGSYALERSRDAGSTAWNAVYSYVQGRNTAVRSTVRTAYRSWTTKGQPTVSKAAASTGVEVPKSNLESKPRVAFSGLDPSGDSTRYSGEKLKLD